MSVVFPRRLSLRAGVQRGSGSTVCIAIRRSAPLSRSSPASHTSGCSGISGIGHLTPFGSMGTTIRSTTSRHVAIHAWPPLAAKALHRRWRLRGPRSRVHLLRDLLLSPADTHLLVLQFAGRSALRAVDVGCLDRNLSFLLAPSCGDCGSFYAAIPRSAGWRGPRTGCSSVLSWLDPFSSSWRQAPTCSARMKRGASRLPAGASLRSSGSSNAPRGAGSPPAAYWSLCTNLNRSTTGYAAIAATCSSRRGSHSGEHGPTSDLGCSSGGRRSGGARDRMRHRLAKFGLLFGVPFQDQLYLPLLRTPESERWQLRQPLLASEHDSGIRRPCKLSFLFGVPLHLPPRLSQLGPFSSRSDRQCPSVDAAVVRLWAMGGDHDVHPRSAHAVPSPSTLAARFRGDRGRHHDLWMDIRAVRWPTSCRC